MPWKKGGYFWNQFVSPDYRQANWRNWKSIERSLKSKAANFKFYALAKDDSTDATDMSQLVIFTTGIDDEYNVTEEMACLVPLKDTTKSRDSYESVKNKLKPFSLSIVNISGRVTDGAPAMAGKREGLVKVIRKRCNCCPILMFDEVPLPSTSRKFMHKSFKNA